MSMRRTPDPIRRALLTGKARAKTVRRPPWALPELRFLDACTRCEACVQRCAEAVLVVGAGGYPEFDPGRGECTFCGNCADACAGRALDRETVSPPWQWKAAVSAGTCLATRNVVCMSCQDACPMQAIRFLPQPRAVATPRIDADMCTGCGACVGVCPTNAVEWEAASLT